eukprot:GDKI01029712.1.p1 GENE.GDKI01029712.1~~GDKI01029712.1.p1  ORF type:complete len:286 (-),score=37.12 GDKI01029712.1:102-959(-)
MKGMGAAQTKSSSSSSASASHSIAGASSGTKASKQSRMVTPTVSMLGLLSARCEAKTFVQELPEDKTYDSMDQSERVLFHLAEVPCDVMRIVYQFIKVAYVDDFTSRRPEWNVRDTTFNTSFEGGMLKRDAGSGGMRGENCWAWCDLDKNFGTPNLIVKYKLKIPHSEGRESKFTVAPDVILRRNYWATNWVWSIWIDGFEDIGNSTLRTGASEWMEMEHIITKTHTVIKENGQVVVRHQLRKGPFAGDKLFFHWQHLDRSTRSECQMKDLTVHYHNLPDDLTDV